MLEQLLKGFTHERGWDRPPLQLLGRALILVCDNRYNKYSNVLGEYK